MEPTALLPGQSLKQDILLSQSWELTTSPSSRAGVLDLSQCASSAITDVSFRRGWNCLVMSVKLSFGEVNNKMLFRVGCV